ncbi:dolichyl-phosphate beta-glucosyltransferase [Ischnura elegans]|uniref:dolichyl-phosphate beta-glucosyltransferase n=1 Tax=Ischnura elegans TaxID=197161 RepID=UPI001ED87159|nr:dolichyl-phosphate beta-glucosyltransferase [Ischnura elegans]XP_046394928.1 dolichyl-phosphate beta-glucosyltransferase [Ischnura elegans]XP_046394929.1 dolichyl-phosphate beta-glucosyltransferase [Ischnura elegans]
MMYDLYSLALYAAISLLLLFSLFCLVLCKVSSPYPNVLRLDEEKYFVDPVNGNRVKFPSLDDKWSVHLSVIIPAYNEESRLPPMLEECLEYLSSREPNFLYELIVVSDGSRDKTVQVASKSRNSNIRVLDLKLNRGKGGAVRLGVESCRGALILFADADGATKFSDLSKLEDSLRDLVEGDYRKDPSKVSEALAVVCGSRAHLEAESVAKRSIFRTFLMWGFHLLVKTFGVRDIKDTQCGFKLFTRRSAQLAFRSLHVERWAFDVELLYIAKCLKIPIAEIAVNWTEIEGSKIVPVLSWLQMGKDLFLIWLRYRLGAWKLRTKVD